MAKLALIYGLRLLPADDVEEVGSAPVVLKNGGKAEVTMHLIEAESEEHVKQQLLRSLEAFFDFYPEI